MTHTSPLFAARQLHLQAALRVLRQQREGAVVDVCATADHLAVGQLVLGNLAIFAIGLHIVRLVLQGIALGPEVWLI